MIVIATASGMPAPLRPGVSVEKSGARGPDGEGARRAGDAVVELPGRTMNRVWKVTVVMLRMTSMACFAAGWGLWRHFAWTRPTSPVPADGRIYPLDTHGWRVFLDAHERLELRALWVAFPVLFLLGFSIDRLKKPSD